MLIFLNEPPVLSPIMYILTTTICYSLSSVNMREILFLNFRTYMYVYKRITARGTLDACNILTVIFKLDKVITRVQRKEWLAV